MQVHVVTGTFASTLLISLILIPVLLSPFQMQHQPSFVSACNLSLSVSTFLFFPNSYTNHMSEAHRKLFEPLNHWSNRIAELANILNIEVIWALKKSTSWLYADTVFSSGPYHLMLLINWCPSL